MSREGARGLRRVVGLAGRWIVRGSGTPQSLVARILLGLFSTWFLAAGAITMVLLFTVAGGASQQPASAAAAECMFAEGSPDAPPPELTTIYRAAASAPEYPLGDRGWAVLAAINRIETNFGRNVRPSSAGAQGWMQFMPATWARYRVDVRRGPGGEEVHDVGGPGADWNDRTDAIHSAANYLHALLRENGGDWRRAVWGYNHAWWYVDDVLGHADGYQGACTTVSYRASSTGPGAKADLRGDGTATVPEAAPEPVKRMIAAANLIANTPYTWGGGHPPSDTIRTGYDCSGYTMFILRAAGLWGDANGVASEFRSWGDPGPGDWVTVYASTTHVWMVIAGRRFDSGGTGRPGSAWRANLTSVSGFTPRHPPGL